jgi:predicted DNA-binding transcriptional regulator AlpA
LRKAGTLPEPIHISARAVAWSVETLDTYIEERRGSH